MTTAFEQFHPLAKQASFGNMFKALSNALSPLKDDTAKRSLALLGVGALGGGALGAASAAPKPVNMLPRLQVDGQIPPQNMWPGQFNE